MAAAAKASTMAHLRLSAMPSGGFDAPVGPDSDRRHAFVRKLLFRLLGLGEMRQSHAA